MTDAEVLNVQPEISVVPWVASMKPLLGREDKANVL